MNKIAIIGGTGLENPDFLKNAREEKINTPFGEPSSTILSGQIQETEEELLSRHGRDNSIPPSAADLIDAIFIGNHVVQKK